MMTSAKSEDWAFQVSECEQLVLTYESLARQIAKLLLDNEGVTRNISAEDFAFYRRLALRRDLVCDMIRVTEQRLLGNYTQCPI